MQSLPDRRLPFCILQIADGRLLEIESLAQNSPGGDGRVAPGGKVVDRGVAGRGPGEWVDDGLAADKHIVRARDAGFGSHTSGKKDLGCQSGQRGCRGRARVRFNGMCEPFESTHKQGDSGRGKHCKESADV
jgi:hypothetical protein